MINKSQTLISKSIASVLLFVILLQAQGCLFPSKPAYDSSRFEPQNEMASNEPILIKNLKPIFHTGNAPRQPEVFGREESSEGAVSLLSKFTSHSAHRGLIHALVVSSDGRTAYTGGADRKVIRHEILESGEKKIRTEVLLQAKQPVYALALSPSGDKLAIAITSAVFIFDLKTQKITNHLYRIQGRLTALSWDPREELLLIGKANGEVFAWDFLPERGGGEDSWDALERYEGGISPIVSLIFHPSSRAFFAVEREGIVHLWRLIRTGEELGLRDKLAKVDKEKIGRKNSKFAQLKIIIHDAWVAADGSRLFVATADGNIYSWKIRGLRGSAISDLGYSSVTSITGAVLAEPGVEVELRDDGKTTLPSRLLVTSGRGGGVKFWCNKDNILEASAGVASSGTKVLLAEVPMLDSPATLVRFGSHSRILWVAQKTGNLLTFNANMALPSSDKANPLIVCAK